MEGAGGGGLGDIRSGVCLIKSFDRRFSLSSVIAGGRHTSHPLSMLG